ncbi:retrovirus-related pol polyprotein from transposon TNT 1-94 [Tanacetum coccineum]
MLFTMPSWKQVWTEKTIPVAEGSSKITTEGYMENYKNVSQDIRDQLNVEAEAKAIERLKQGESINVQDLETNLYWEFGKFTSRDGESLESYYSRSQQVATRNRVKAIVKSPSPTYDQEPTMVSKDDEMSKEKDSDKLMALISLSFKKIYKPTNNNLRTSSNISRANHDNTPRINKGIAYDNQRVVYIAGDRENAAGIQLSVEQADWRDDTDDEPKDQELEAHYLYMAHIQEVNPDTAKNSGPIFDAEPLYTWTHFLRSKDKTPEVLIAFLKLVQRGLYAQQMSTAQTPEQNGVVERRNRTLVEAARTMLSAAKVPLFFWAEAITAACFTQNRSLVIPRHEKTPYHFINGRKPFVKFFYIFGSLCYIVRDGENLDKMNEKGDACIFVRYSTQSRAYRVYNKRTRVTVETIHVNFDELPLMASDHVSSYPIPQCLTMALEQDSLSPGPQSQENVPKAAETEELHQFDRLDVWELVDRPLCKNVINMKWLWKNKHGEENTVIHNKARLVAKGYSQQEGIDF